MICRTEKPASRERRNLTSPFKFKKRKVLQIIDELYVKKISNFYNAKNEDRPEKDIFLTEKKTKTKANTML